jgi:hypothetical protein
MFGNKNKPKKSDLDYCEADAKHDHCWILIGPRTYGGVTNGILYKCTQCNKCKIEPIRLVDRGDKTPILGVYAD